MKIRWIGESREVAGVGLLAEGDERAVAESVGRSLIDQGLAEKAPGPKRKPKQDKPQTGGEGK